MSITYRDVILTFDAMSIQPALRYDEKNDIIIGFHDAGDCDTGNTISDAANSLLVFMVKGIKEPWKQPLGYYPVKNGISQIVLQNMLLKMLYYLHQIGLRVMSQL